ncbi:Stp1/IreP family PP2C-type Ser/Thr phosphatase [Selenomonas caprae]|uniref:Protein phosphatase n=2 Tax=Selenomonas TaxID=970 RepID=A0A1I3BL56_SELRU|nr:MULTISPECIES: Stp1/IreP family PP2C-type Ser/Thr phosphatase [Selenomonas]TYZ30431.1 Stp1/IreP family PP2C-type Ser/Thr phosphatase [Selenomonas caprae]SFH62998.1 protein phosphatase [Selenomonas ruminantium]
MIQVYEATDVGLVRPRNEDCAVVFEPSTYVVADGMGGHVAGEVASHLLTDTVRRQLSGVAAIGEEELRQAVLAGNRAILDCEKENPDYKGMGTTATVLHLAGDEAYWAHVGDSRLYLLRGDSLRQVTRDHSYVEDLVVEGTITEAEARVHPKRNYLTRAVGVEADLEVDTGRFSVQQQDILLLATDGLMKAVDDDAIGEILRAGGEDPAAELIQQALAGGGRDNITAIVVVCGP